MSLIMVNIWLINSPARKTVQFISMTAGYLAILAQLQTQGHRTGCVRVSWQIIPIFVISPN